ncbi:response regulator transcription factor [Lysobacter panacisoli]|uniref:Response regulator transcription factor n=1 Tax=Lysobacter panacisoli TaxID=1255263 RepID=A0ABP9LPE1_9GAMM|nr:response regulator transcription factor [Lysobacter panacisoli]
MKNTGGLILIVEDHLAIAEMVGEYLESLGYEVDFARDGTDALRLTHETNYDAIILDRSLPRLDGLDVCRRIRKDQRCSTPILMLTARDTLDDKVTGLEAGADDYLTKPFAIQELEARVRALIRRDRKAMGGGTLRVADLVLDPEAMTVHRAGQELRLSPTGFQLLHILMRESPRVVSRQEIEREIWKGEAPDSDTLRSHLYNLRKTIDRPFDHPLLHTMQTAGYKVADLRPAQPPAPEPERAVPRTFTYPQGAVAPI